MRDVQISAASDSSPNQKFQNTVTLCAQFGDVAGLLQTFRGRRDQ